MNDDEIQDEPFLYSVAFSTGMKRPESKKQSLALVELFARVCNACADDQTGRLSMGVSSRGELYVRVELAGRVSWANGRSWPELLQSIENMVLNSL